MPAIPVTPTLSIDDSELAFAFARASGPGGQNVNKVESAVHLRFDVANSPSLDDGTKRRLGALAGRRLTADGVLVLFAQQHRSQERNRADALGPARRADRRRRRSGRSIRVKTRPSLSAKRRRTDAKVHRGDIKRGRGRVTDV